MLEACLLVPTAATPREWLPTEVLDHTHANTSIPKNVQHEHGTPSSMITQTTAAVSRAFENQGLRVNTAAVSEVLNGGVPLGGTVHFEGPHAPRNCPGGTWDAGLIVAWSR